MGLLRNRLTEVGEKRFLENTLNLGLKTSPSSQTFSIPSNFETTAEAMSQGISVK